MASTVALVHPVTGHTYDAHPRQLPHLTRKGWVPVGGEPETPEPVEPDPTPVIDEPVDDDPAPAWGFPTPTEED